jgi:muramidase (phage lysozyme)
LGNLPINDVNSLTGHPSILVNAGVSNSTAFGRYQFNVATWSNFGSGGMTPSAQDLAMNNLMNRTGMVADAMGGDIVQAIWDGNARWASLPDSPYNQNPKSWAETIGAFQDALNNLPECQ